MKRMRVHYKSVGGDVLDAPPFRDSVAFHNSFLQKYAKIVKVFMPESLDYFFRMCYNMIDVKIGLTVESFGQFGDGFAVSEVRVFTGQNLSEAAWSAQTIFE